MSDDTLIPQPKIKFSWLIGTLAAFALFALIGAYAKRMTETYTGYDELRAQARYETLAKVQKAESKLINPIDDQGKPTAEWVDQDKGIIRIPIEEAMAKEVEDLKNQTPQAGNEIPVPAPAAPAPASGAATPTAAGPAAATIKPNK